MRDAVMLEATAHLPTKPIPTGPKAVRAALIDRYGNTSAASIPLVLAEAADDGRLTEGDLVLVSGFGAGLTWGSALLRWGHA